MASGPILTAALVGAGNRGATHLDTVSRLQRHFRLVGVCDARSERRDWAAQTYGVPVFDHPVGMIEAERPQVVAVVVPPDAHHLVTAVAAARGCHVLSETPVATTLAMADHMIESARRYSVLLEVSENVWRWPQERLKRLVVEQGLIGRVTQAHVWYTSGSYHGMSAARRFLTGRPVRALGVTQPVEVPPFQDIDGEIQRQQAWELGVIEFDDGGRCVYQWPVASDRGNHWEIIGTRGAIMGSDLLLSEGIGRRQHRRYPIETIMGRAEDGGETIERVQVATDPPVVWENPHRSYALPGPDDVARADIWLGLHPAIVEGRSATTYGAAARTDQELLIAIRESARLGSVWVDLPLRDETGLECQMHDEFRRQYADPFGDPEALVGQFFPRPSVAQTAYGTQSAP